jgi:hypothetical protein
VSWSGCACEQETIEAPPVGDGPAPRRGIARASHQQPPAGKFAALTPFEELTAIDPDKQVPRPRRIAFHARPDLMTPIGWGSEA